LAAVQARRLHHNGAEAVKRRTVRRLAWVGLALTAVALALGVTVSLLDLLPGVTEANVRRIQPGMLPAEVEALLGGPPVEVGIESWPDVRRALKDWPGRGAWVWTGKNGAAWVNMTIDGRVLRASWVRRKTTSSPRLRDVLGL
jgi:hypothetical protein